MATNFRRDTLISRKMRGRALIIAQPLLAARGRRSPPKVVVVRKQSKNDLLLCKILTWMRAVTNSWRVLQVIEGGIMPIWCILILVKTIASSSMWAKREEVFETAEAFALGEGFQIWVSWDKTGIICAVMRDWLPNGSNTNIKMTPLVGWTVVDLTGARMMVTLACHDVPIHLCKKCRISKITACAVAINLCRSTDITTPAIIMLMMNLMK
mmetsp:Transcript_23216/g.39308  ORF Transcript_23216/g.39308 Transcript_23216/m.39308 type:complete len:211 (-) Transcript_23216:733-1365(-)